MQPDVCSFIWLELGTTPVACAAGQSQGLLGYMKLYEAAAAFRGSAGSGVSSDGFL